MTGLDERVVRGVDRGGKDAEGVVVDELLADGDILLCVGRAEVHCEVK